MNEDWFWERKIKANDTFLSLLMYFTRTIDILFKCLKEIKRYETTKVETRKIDSQNAAQNDC